MLNKEICLKCHFSRHKVWSDKNTKVYFNPRWEAGWVMCPSPEGGYSVEIAEPPPPICPYVLEHAVNQC
jgi:hypothetical protein